MFNYLRKKVYKILRKTEKYTKTDNVYLAKGGFWLIFKQIGGTITALLLAMLWARFVPKEIYGQYKFIISIAGFLIIFSLPGMSTAITRSVARNFEGTVKLALKTKLKWSTLAAISGFFLAFYYGWRGNQILSISFLIVGILSPFVNSFTVHGDYLAGKKRFGLQAKYNLASNFLAALATAIAIFLTKNVVYLILVYFVSRAVLHILFYLSVLKKIPPNKNIDPEAVTYGKHLSLIAVLGQIATHIDQILVFHFLGAVELAVYSFAILVPNQIKTLAKYIEHLALPKFSVRNSKELKKTVLSKTIRMGIFLTTGVILYLLFAGLIFKIFFPNYIDSVVYSRIYSLALLGMITAVPEVIFWAKAKTKIIYTYSIFGDLTKILIIFISLYYFGLMGLVVGLVIHRFISTVFIFFMLRYL